MKNSRKKIFSVTRETSITLIYLLALLLSIVSSTLGFINEMELYNKAFFFWMIVSTACLTVIFVNKEKMEAEMLIVFIVHMIAIVIMLVLAFIFTCNIESVTFSGLFTGESQKSVTYYYEKVAIYTGAIMPSVGFIFLFTAGAHVVAGIWKIMNV